MCGNFCDVGTVDNGGSSGRNEKLSLILVQDVAVISMRSATRWLVAILPVIEAPHCLHVQSMPKDISHIFSLFCDIEIFRFTFLCVFCTFKCIHLMQYFEVNKYPTCPNKPSPSDLELNKLTLILCRH